MTKMNEKTARQVESRLAKGQSLRSIAKSLWVTYQTLQYHRRRTGAPPLRMARTAGSGHASWRGGAYTDRYGYRMVLAPGRGKASRYAPEHLLVAEAALGRRLHIGEVVHHVDG